MTDLRVAEVYDRLTVQGEGPHVGRVCTFVRLYGCNLHCRWCDTPFTWDTEGRNGRIYPAGDNHSRLSVETIVARVVALRAPLVIITGGEPLLQYSGVKALAHELHRFAVEVHVETNGTIPPQGDDGVAHYTVSPKLPSAGAGPKALPIPSLLAWSVHPRAVFKVVVSDPDEVRQADELFDLLHVPARARWVMPEGIDALTLNCTLRRIADEAIVRRLNISPRLHVDAWGNTRGR